MPITAVPGVRSDADEYTSGLVLHNGSGGGRSVGCGTTPMAESSSSEVLALDRRVESGLECDWMNRQPGSGCGTSRRAM